MDQMVKPSPNITVKLSLDLSFNYPIYNALIGGIQKTQCSDLQFALAQDLAFILKVLKALILSAIMIILALAAAATV
ncbi:MAG: hypothetical protein R2865_10550 [Deinococcales bacterium]